MSDMYLGQSVDTGQKIIIPVIDRFGHLLIVGPTRSGKTSKIIKPCIWQDLIDIKLKQLKYEAFVLQEKINLEKKITAVKRRKYLSKEESLEKIEILSESCIDKINSINKQKYKAGLSVVEPKGDLAEDVKNMCEVLDMHYTYVNPLDENTAKFNIMQGDADIVAETTRTVLRNLFGKQEAFYAQVQETTARNTILLLKKVLGDEIDIIDVTRALRDEKILKRYVSKYEDKYGDDDLVEYYKSEVFGVLKEKFYQFALGLRQQLEDIAQNKYLQRVLLGNSDINLDKHMENGGVLVVNTAMGKLGKLGDTFGQFVIMNIQNAVFRREGDEWTRAYHYLWIDEAPRYLNPDIERLLAIGGSYRCSTNLAIQTISQLRLEANNDFTGVALANCRNKVIFAGLPSEEAKLFQSEFGADMVRSKQHTYDYRNLLPFPKLLPKSYRTTEEIKNRYDYTDIIELKSWFKKAEALVRYYSKGQIQPPVKIMTYVKDYSKKPKKIIAAEKKVKTLKKILQKFQVRKQKTHESKKNQNKNQVDLKVKKETTQSRAYVFKPQNKKIYTDKKSLTAVLQKNENNTKKKETNNNKVDEWFG